MAQLRQLEALVGGSGSLLCRRPLSAAVQLDQCVVDIDKGVLQCALIAGQQLFAAPWSDRCGQTGGRSRKSADSAPTRPTRHVSRFATDRPAPCFLAGQIAGERNRREQCCLGDADAGVGGDQLGFWPGIRPAGLRAIATAGLARGRQRQGAQVGGDVWLRLPTAALLFGQGRRCCMPSNWRRRLARFRLPAAHPDRGPRRPGAVVGQAERLLAGDESRSVCSNASRLRSVT